MKIFKNRYFKIVVVSSVAALVFSITGAGEIIGAGIYRIVYSAMNSGSAETTGAGSLKVTYSIGDALAHPELKGGKYTLNGGFVTGAAPGLEAADTPEKAHAYPVPFRPSRGHSSISFSGLTAKCRIRIYTISGKLVNTLEKNDAATDQLKWYPVVNQWGEGLASGVYIFYVDDYTGRSRSGKLVIIK